MDDVISTFAVLDFKKEQETRECLESIRKHAKFKHKIVYLDNGGNEDYSWQIYKDNLCDVLISKKIGKGAGFGQVDLFRFCDTKYIYFVQNDQTLINDITEETNKTFIDLINNGFKCVGLNGDQSHKGIWTDRAHFMETSFFNSLAPFPCGGPGNDALPWNEAYMQKIFEEHAYKIAQIRPIFFQDNGKWSVREAGDGLYKHRCDSKEFFILKKPTFKTEIYPPFNEEEWRKALDGTWENGTIPEAWKDKAFSFWK